MPPSPRKPPKVSPGRSSPSVAHPPSGGVGPLESSPSWRARRCSAASPAGSSSGRPGGSARSGPRGPGGWRTPPPAHGRPSSVPRGPCSGKVCDGQGEKGGWGGLPSIHPPQPSLRPVTPTEQPHELRPALEGTQQSPPSGACDTPLEGRETRDGERLTLGQAGDARGSEAPLPPFCSSRDTSLEVG